MSYEYVIKENNYINEHRIMVACYICDENGKRLKFEEYLEKGKVLEIVTEETTYEVATQNRRYRGGRVEEILYWNPDLYHSNLINLDTESRENEDEDILSDMQRFRSYPQQNPIVFDSDIKNNKEVVFNSKINDHTNNSIIRISEYRNSKLLHSGNPEDEPQYIPDQDGPVYTHMRAVERYCSHDKFRDSPFAIIDTVDDHVKLGIVSEIYANMTPSVRYVTKDLNKTILSIISDNRLQKYNFKKIIIGEHNTPVLKNIKSKDYRIEEKTFQILFDRFKEVEINNTIVNIIFPEGKINIENLELVNCNISTNNTTINIEKELKIYNCTFVNNGSDGEVRHLVFNISSDIKVETININDISRLSFININDTPNLNAEFINIKYNLRADNKVKGSLVNIVGFMDLSVTGVNKSDNTFMPNLTLLNIISCTTITIFNIDNKSDNYKNLLSIKGFDELNIDSLIDKSDNSRTLLNISKISDESEINLSEIKTSCNKIVNFTGANLYNFSVNDSIIKCNKFWSLINSDINKINLNDSDIDIMEEFTFNGFQSIDFHETSMYVKDMLKFIVGTELSFTKSTIESEKMEIVLDKKTSVYANDTYFDINKSFKIHNGDESSRIDLVKSTFEGDLLEITDSNVLDFSYCFILNREFLIKDISALDFIETTLRINKLNRLLIEDIGNIKPSDLFIDNGGDFILETKNIEGLFRFLIKENTKINRNSIESKTSESYKKNKDNINFKLIIDSIGGGSSGYFLDNKSDIIVNPLCADFNLFKPYPENFNKSSAGKGVYENIYYGKI